MLPSRRMQIVIAVILIAIAGFFLYSYKKKAIIGYVSGDSSNANVPSVLKISDSAAQIDTDLDQLPDWEEALYGTDPKKADSDLDGTVDGTEVKEGRNPLKKGPNDAIILENNTQISTNSSEKLTATDVFARDFFTQYLRLSASGVTVTAENADEIIDDYLKIAPLPTVNAKTYSKQDIKTTSSSETSLRAYESAITAVFAKYWPSGNNNEMLVFYETFSKDNPEALEGLTSVISAYQNTLSNTLALTVPDLVVNQHLNILNSLGVYIETLKMIQKAYSDPISGLVGLNIFLEKQAKLQTDTANLKIFLINSLK